MARHFRLGYTEEPGQGEWPHGPSLIIPYLTYNGVVAVRYRALDPEKQGWRYVSQTGAGTWLYNVSDILAGPRILCLCEGEIDSMTMSYKAGIPTIGLGGTSAWKPIFAKVLESAEKVMVCADGGKGGTSMIEAFCEPNEQGKRRLSHAVPCQLPEEHDVNSYYLAYGAPALYDFVMERA